MHKEVNMEMLFRLHYIGVMKPLWIYYLRRGPITSSKSVMEKDDSLLENVL
jgi:hypothetical protein